MKPRSGAWLHRRRHLCRSVGERARPRRVAAAHQECTGVRADGQLLEVTGAPSITQSFARFDWRMDANGQRSGTVSPSVSSLDGQFVRVVSFWSWRDLLHLRLDRWSGKGVSVVRPISRRREVMAITCPVNLDTLMLRQEIQSIYARVAVAPSGELPLPSRAALRRRSARLRRAGVGRLASRQHRIIRRNIANPHRIALIKGLRATVVDIGCGAAAWICCSPRRRWDRDRAGDRRGHDRGDGRSGTHLCVSTSASRRWKCVSAMR